MSDPPSDPPSDSPSDSPSDPPSGPLSDPLADPVATPARSGRQPGRPRSEQAERAILDATLDLLAEEAGVAGVSVEAVAARARVGKATIYRRWPNKEALIVDALARLKEPLPVLTGESVRGDLITLARALCGDQGRRRVRSMWTLVGSADKHRALLERFSQTVIEPRREVLRGVLRRGVATGELRRDLDIETAVAVIIGPMAMLARPWEQAPPDLAERVVDLVLGGIAAGAEPSG